jgi:hypothetical protein
MLVIQHARQKKGKIKEKRKANNNPVKSPPMYDEEIVSHSN